MTKIETISDLLRKKGLILCAAESFTGGGIASDFVAKEGASDVFALSAVCYSNQAKHKILGVSEATIRDYGAVSEQTVSEMLDGLKSTCLGDIFVATSGNAGPTAEKVGEVGVFYIGVMYKGKKDIKRFFCDGDRARVIQCGKESAYDMLLDVLTR